MPIRRRALTAQKLRDWWGIGILFPVFGRESLSVIKWDLQPANPWAKLNLSSCRGKPMAKHEYLHWLGSAILALPFLSCPSKKIPKN
jgi:hypothetical protein